VQKFTVFDMEKIFVKTGSPVGSARRDLGCVDCCGCLGLVGFKDILLVRMPVPQQLHGLDRNRWD
jgi:hypothetical protein